MNEIARHMPGRWRSPAPVALDATGLAQAAVSTYFIRRVEHFGQKQRSWKHWLKWLAVVDVERQIILAQSARHAPWLGLAFNLYRLWLPASQTFQTTMSTVPNALVFFLAL